MIVIDHCLGLIDSHIPAILLRNDLNFGHCPRVLMVCIYVCWKSVDVGGGGGGLVVGLNFVG